MDDAYHQSIETNELIVGYCLGYQQTDDKRYLHGTYNLLLPTSRQVIFGIVKDAHLGFDIHQDMLQDAYLRLSEAIYAWDWHRCPVFLTYWRQVLRNHLIGKYQKHWRHRALPEEYDEPAPRENVQAKVALEEIKQMFLARIESWNGEKHKEMAKVILLERIFNDSPTKPSQRDIAEMFGVQPAICSHWEIWIRKTLREEY